VVEKQIGGMTPEVWQGRFLPHLGTGMPAGAKRAHERHRNLGTLRTLRPLLVAALFGWSALAFAVDKHATAA